MSTSSQQNPKYRHYKPKNLGVVRIDGKDHYLGKYNSPESWEKYHRLLAERYSRGPATPAPTDQAKSISEILTIEELCRGYYRYAEKYYVKNGKVTNQVRLIRLSLHVLNKLYAGTLAKDFGPLALEACQGEFVRQGLARRECNRRTALIRGAFRWGVKKQLVSGEVWHSLQAVGGLKKGRCEAHDPPAVGPVAERVVERTIEHLSPTVGAMVKLQLLTGMRPGELVIMRARDLDMSGPVWQYTPSSSKTEHHEA
jgi:integrase